MSAIVPTGRTVRIPYKPRDVFLPYHQRKQRWAAIVAHRRAGKTVAVINDIIKAAVKSKLQDPRYAYIAPIFAQAKDVAWAYLKYFTMRVPGAVPHEAELRVDFPHNGARVRLYGAENYERMRGIYLDGAGIDEYGDMDPRAWQEVLRPALSDRLGWATFIGTPKGSNHFEEKWNEALKSGDWFHSMLKASETGLISAAELADNRRAMSDEQYMQEFECSFLAGIVGSFYAKAMQAAQDEGRIRDLPHHKDLEVYTWWDLGIDDATSIWFMQRAGDEVRLIDYYENSGTGLEHYAGILRQKHEAFGYRYARRGHLLPHDVKVEELGTGLSRLGTLKTFGVIGVPTEKWSLEDGINATRELISRSWFDRTKCERGIQCLRNYKREWDNKLKVFKEKPRHDWSSHGADAFRTGAVVWKKNPTFEILADAQGAYDPLSPMDEQRSVIARPTSREVHTYGRTEEFNDYDPFEHH